MLKKTIIECRSICKSFKKEAQHDRLVLDDVDLEMREGEIVALLGKSGAGKSTLLRIISGLIAPSHGDVLYRDQSVKGPQPGISMVFQNFALMPWLTVLQNVELGLEALRVPRKKRRQLALKTIDTIGLDGFESAFPKELSGGMCQRVGVARALVMEPDLLLMDEPFSALDVLTADNLRSDLLDLWLHNKTKTKGMLIVTHSIEEAILLADRILIFGSNPGSIRVELAVEMSHPRNENDIQFRALVDEIYRLMTTHPEISRASGESSLKSRYENIRLEHRLPDVDVSELTGLLEEVACHDQETPIDLPELAESLHLDVDELFTLTEALELLHFAKVSEGDIELTSEGRGFAQADILERKKLFAKQLQFHLPLVRYVCTVLHDRPSHRASKERFLAELRDHLSEKEAERVLQVVIDWGRYAELFAYDFNSHSLSLDNPG